MTTPVELAAAERAYVIAPAGCGKTELIAAAVAAGPIGRQLVLTHTHAGVGALRSRLRRYGVSRDQVRLETIAGFALRFASAYPATSEFAERQPRAAAWSEVYAAAGRVVAGSLGQRVLAASYAGVYVDEYQDCVTDQHDLVMHLADVLPTRVLGDPLQGIFGFRGQQLVAWEDVDKHFARLPDLDTPWRWRDTNPDLGKWLLEIRPLLLSGRRPDFRSGPITVGLNSDAGQIMACGKFIGEQSVVAIRKWAKNAHLVASRLGGNYTSMEEMESKDLFNQAASLDNTSGNELAVAVIEFARLCVTQVSRQLGAAEGRFRDGSLPVARRGAPNEAAIEALRRVAEDDNPRVVAEALLAIRRLPESKTFRAELLSEMVAILKTAASTPGRPWADVAWEVRDRARRNGRVLERRVVSRTLLIKGLEFDHAIVLDADELDEKNLYVALTRGSKSLTVLTAT